MRFLTPFIKSGSKPKRVAKTHIGIYIVTEIEGILRNLEFNHSLCNLVTRIIFKIKN